MHFAKTSRWSALVLSLVACSPALDWRDVQPEGSGAAVLFPCKPDRFARTLTLAGTKVQMTLASCAAAGTTFALRHADLDDPAKLSAALGELRGAAAQNIGGAPHDATPFAPRGATPNPLAERVAIEGRRADGHAVRMQAAFFARGMRVYQASVVGEQVDAEAADTFFSGLKLL